MEKFLRKALLIGMGVAALGKEKMESFLEDLSKTAENVGDEDILSQIVKKGEETREDLENKIVKELGGLITKGKFATKEDISRIEDKIDRLEKIIKEKQK
ncbi:hypothetical protein IBX65_00645 [Candidatus Aerophobetes bacterium]|nr:hypothetical protein [Candidatus Aerophobetes bacterium]